MEVPVEAFAQSLDSPSGLSSADDADSEDSIPSDGSSSGESSDDAPAGSTTSDTDVTTSSETGSDSSAKKSSEADAGDADDEEADDDTKLTDQEEKKVKESDSQIDKASSYISTFSSSMAALDLAVDNLQSKCENLQKLEKQREEYETQIVLRSQDYIDAQAVMDDLVAEQADLESTSVLSLVFRRVDYDDLTSRVIELKQLQSDQLEVIEAARLEATEGDEGLAEWDAKIADQEDAIEDFISTADDTAYALETADSDSRIADKAAVSAVEKLDADKKPDAKEAQDKAERAVASHDSSRAEARAALAAWYDAVDAVSGVDSALSFGVGQDFSLSEEEFVKKWGAAIDAFYEQFGSSAGFTCPLQGWGKTMAKYAYEYKVDPRLCAAVSIAESSGGEYCIKSHNAWGWGAADEDPSGLAESWDSWEAAIEAWHKGMVESETGMATAGSISGVGEIYCSTPTWAATVCEQMAKISAFA